MSFTIHYLHSSFTISYELGRDELLLNKLTQPIEFRVQNVKVTCFIMCAINFFHSLETERQVKYF